MNDETKIKLQGHLDGELSAAETREVSTLLHQNIDARLLLGELTFVKNALHGNELELKLPETREFYWSKIQKGIERAEKQQASAPAFSWWKPVYARFVGGLAATCALLMISFIAFNNGGSAPYAAGEVEGTEDGMGAITFRSEPERMTVVYLFDRESGEVVDSTKD